MELITRSRGHWAMIAYLLGTSPLAETIYAALNGNLITRDMLTIPFRGSDAIAINQASAIARSATRDELRRALESVPANPA